MNRMITSKFLSNGMIVERDKNIHIYGWETEKKAVSVEMYYKNKLIASDNAKISSNPLYEKREDIFCSDTNPAYKDIDKSEEFKYRFDISLPPQPAGGPYTIKISSENSKIVITDILSGDLYQIAGQSNIELPMRRVLESYPEEMNPPDDPYLRVFKVTECGNFHAPLADVQSGRWEKVSRGTMLSFSALGYFFAKALRTETKIPVGLIDTSLGGSRIETWMSKEELSSFPDLYSLAEKYSDDSFIASEIDQNTMNQKEWNILSEKEDKGMNQKFNVLSNWENIGNDINVPCFFSDIPKLKGFTGIIWLGRHFKINTAMEGKEAHLWLGTITDSDTVYINGTKVGTTAYKYPPRRYTIPCGLLKKGENEIVIRLAVQNGTGYITPGKALCIFTGNATRITDGYIEKAEGAENLIDISGEWKYIIGCRLPHIKPNDFINWKPTALRNGMLNACTNIPVKGFIWYQGEANSGKANIYGSEFNSMVNGLRQAWNDPYLPFYVIKLPEFDYSTYEPDGTGANKDYWQQMQEAQADLKNLPYTYVLESKGTGEINDLHPQRKKPLGEALAKLVIKNRPL